MDIRPRKRLYRRLDELRQAHSVAWIVAPAGSGKTALVASYIESRHVPALCEIHATTGWPAGVSLLLRRSR
jgi:hypothetical protein